MPFNRIPQFALYAAVPVGIATVLSSISVAVPPNRSDARTGVLTTLDPSAWVNIRSAPTTDAAPVQQGTAGEPVEVLREQRGQDGFTWYFVRSGRSQAQGWVRGDLIDLRPGQTRVATAPMPVQENAEVSANPFPEYQPVPLNGGNTANTPNPFARASTAGNSAGNSSAAVTGQASFNAAPMPYESTATRPTAPRPAASAQAPMPYEQREYVFDQSASTAQVPATVAPMTTATVDQTVDQTIQSEPAWAPPLGINAATTANLPDRPNNLLLPRAYTPEQINYFMEVALGAEFGEAGGTVRKWNQPVRIQVHGNPTPQDRATLSAVVRELNELTSGISLELVDSGANVDLHFAPESQFSSIESNYRPRNMGFFWTWWNGGEITRARILISTTGVNQNERSHLIREELTQSLGLMRDSRRYADSIFYQGWTDVTQYSAIDRAIISMLYRPEVRAGMSRTQAEAALRNVSGGGRSANACGVEVPFTDWRFTWPWENCNVQ